MWGILNKLIFFSTGAVVICTESLFPSKRLHQLIDGVKKRYPIVAGITTINFTENIFIDQILEIDKLLFCVTQQLPKLCEEQNIGLILIDSVGAIFRTESNPFIKAEKMRQFTRSLITLSKQHQIAIVCLNQMTTFIENDNEKSMLVPCLGLVWSNEIRTRLILKRTRRDNVDDGGDSCVIDRKMEMNFSPDLPKRTARFSICNNGVVNARKIEMAVNLHANNEGPSRFIDVD